MLYIDQCEHGYQVIVKTEMPASILLLEQLCICIIDHFFKLKHYISPHYIVIHCVDEIDLIICT